MHTTVRLLTPSLSSIRLSHLYNYRLMSSHSIQTKSSEEKRKGVVCPVVETSASRFLAPTIAFTPPAPLTPSFYDLHSWPSNPLPLLAQWYAQAEEDYNKRSPQTMDGPTQWPNTMSLATGTCFPLHSTLHHFPIPASPLMSLSVYAVYI